MEKKEKSTWVPPDCGTSITVLGCPLQPLFKIDLYITKSLIWATVICTDLTYNWYFFVILKMLILLQCVLNRSTNKEEYSGMTPVPLLAMEGEEVLTCSAFLTHLSHRHEGSQGCASRGRKLREGSAVYLALCTLAVHLNSH